MLSRLADNPLPVPVYVESTAATEFGHTGGKCSSLALHVLMQLLCSSRPGPKPHSTGQLCSITHYCPTPECSKEQSCCTCNARLLPKPVRVANTIGRKFTTTSKWKHAALQGPPSYAPAVDMHNRWTVCCAPATQYTPNHRLRHSTISMSQTPSVASLALQPCAPVPCCRPTPLSYP